MKMIEVTIKNGNQKVIINELNCSFAKLVDGGCVVVESDGANSELVETYEEIKIKLGIK